jgi:hypothetical protein
LPDIDAKLEEFAMDPRCAPERVRDADLSNELAKYSPANTKRSMTLKVGLLGDLRRSTLSW